MTFTSVLHHHRANLALVIGNGINKYGSAARTNSWDDLLVALAGRFLGSDFQEIPEGIALTEFYDLLELMSGPSISGKSLQKEFCKQLLGWEPHEHHERIVSWAQEAKCPLLTTNFENALAKAGNCKLLHTRRDGFTDYYPWETYYGNAQLSEPKAGFGIWHINGMEYYQRSIRLGLSHYMGSVQRARSWIHRGKTRRLFSGKNIRNWRGVGTWLDVFFHKPLLIFGLGLEENEVFLRWLLIERARYFRKFPDRATPAWFAYTDEVDGSGKLFFLKGVGIEPIRAWGYDELYGPAAWC